MLSSAEQVQNAVLEQLYGLIGTQPNFLFNRIQSIYSDSRHSLLRVGIFTYSSRPFASIEEVPWPCQISLHAFAKCSTCCPLEAVESFRLQSIGCLVVLCCMTQAHEPVSVQVGAPSLPRLLLQHVREQFGVGVEGVQVVASIPIGTQRQELAGNAAFARPIAESDT